MNLLEVLGKSAPPSPALVSSHAWEQSKPSNVLEALPIYLITWASQRRAMTAGLASPALMAITETAEMNGFIFGAAHHSGCDVNNTA